MDGHADLVGPPELVDELYLREAGGQGELFVEFGQSQNSTPSIPLMFAQRFAGAGTPAHSFTPEHHGIIEDRLRAQENERLKMGRELHDSTGQLLLALRLEIANLRHIQGSSAEDGLLDEIDHTAREIDREIRAFAFTHYPAEIGREGLGAALRSLANGFASRTGLRIRFTSIPDPISKSGPVALALLRVAQEALLNVHRHAHATNVHLMVTSRRNMLQLSVKDDGVGIRSAQSLEEFHGIGLQGMRHRVERLGGRFAIRRLKHGTKIIATVPA